MKFAVILACLFALTMPAMAQEQLPVGVYHGEGRACFGALYIREKTVEWHASFVSCEKRPYEILKIRQTAEGAKEYVFQIKNPDANCKLPYFTLSRHAQIDNGETWSFAAYKNMDDLESATDDNYSCGLTKYNDE